MNIYRIVLDYIFFSLDFPFVIKNAYQIYWGNSMIISAEGK